MTTLRHILTTVALFLAIQAILAPGFILGQATSDIDRLHHLIDSTHDHSQLIAVDAPSFHISASITLVRPVQDRFPGVFITFEELWRDPRHWKLDIAYDKYHSTTVVDGSTAYTTGTIPDRPLSGRRNEPKWVSAFYDHNSLPRIVQQLQAALFAPFRSVLLRSPRLTSSRAPCHTGPDALMSCQCVVIEPDLTVSSVPLATTSYCINSMTYELHQVKYPDNDGYLIDLYDFAAFGDRQIPRTIDLRLEGSPTWRMHVDTLEPAVDFTLLSMPDPANSTIASGYSQENLLAGDLMRGQVLKEVDLSPYLKHVPWISPVTVYLDVDVTGSVTNCRIGNDKYSRAALTPAALEAAQNFKFRVSYQNEKLVPVTQMITVMAGGMP